MDDDRARFEDIFTRHYPLLVRYAARRVGADHANEIVSETFLIAWRRLDEVPVDRPLPWLYATARHVVANELRARGRRDRLGERIRLQAGVESDPAERITDQVRVRAALARLGERDREALLLAEWEQLDTADAARAMGCSQSAYKVRLHRARKRLAALLVDEPAEPSPVPVLLPEGGIR